MVCGVKVARTIDLVVLEVDRRALRHFHKIEIDHLRVWIRLEEFPWEALALFVILSLHLQTRTREPWCHGHQDEDRGDRQSHSFYQLLVCQAGLFRLKSTKLQHTEPFSFSTHAVSKRIGKKALESVHSGLNAGGSQWGRNMHE